MWNESRRAVAIFFLSALMADKVSTGSLKTIKYLLKQRTEKFTDVFQVLFVDSDYFLNLIVLERGWGKNFVNRQCWLSLNICFTILTGTLDMYVLLKHFFKYVLGMHHHVALACLKLLCRSGCPQACWDLPTSAFEQCPACFVLLLTWLFSTRHQ